MKYYEITPESPVYDVCCKVWNCNATWQKADEDFNELLGTTKGIALRIHRLMVRNVPDHLKKQFCRIDGGFYPAKVHSAVNKRFLEIVEKHGLYYAGPLDIALALGTATSRGREAYHPPMNGKYYLETVRKIRNIKGLVEIAEPEFLRLRADWLESNSEKQS